MYGGDLLQQYVTDAYVKTEADRLNFIETHQKELYAASYTGLNDFLNDRANQTGATIGRKVILPSSFIGSPRAMKQAYQDAMALCGKFGKPTFFLTFTCNPKWNEITKNILSHQSARDRPDLIARVFQLKLKELIKDIEHNQVLGFQVARIYVIEFQKRGLPHAHVLIWIRKDDIPTIEEQMDTTICAEIPNPLLYPKLYRTVMKHMIHGPCGKQNQSSPCMEGEECTKEFPKDFPDGPGGTGKTFLYNTLINSGKSVISVASTGIASLLLIDGRTYHSQFKIYPPIDDKCTSRIEGEDYEAAMIRNSGIIICDEVTMMTSHALDAIDKLFVWK